MSVSSGLGHVVACVTAAEVPASWQPRISAGEVEEDLTRAARQSHESRRYERRFMIRVDETTGRKLDALMQLFAQSAADIIRHLLTQATLEDFPQSWRVAAGERQPQEAQSRQGDALQGSGGDTSRRGHRRT
jgi:hypothetical protein